MKIKQKRIRKRTSFFGNCYNITKILKLYYILVKTLDIKEKKDKIENEVLDVDVILNELNESNEKTLKFYILREIKKIEEELKELERSLLSKETTDVQCQRFEKVMTAMSLDNTTDKVIGGSRRPRTLNNN